MTTRSAGPDSPLERALRTARIDLSGRHPRPAPGRLVVAGCAALLGSLLADAALVAAGRRLFPSTRDFQHFRLPDYATLTVLGVLAACASWPFIARISPDPRWIFARIAVVVTVVLWIPDLALIVRGEPALAVAVLMIMHLGVAGITYSCLVRLAPATVATVQGRREADADDPEGPLRLLTTALAVLVGIESVLGVVALASVSIDRPTGWLPARGSAVYAAHALLGLPLAAGAVLLAARAGGSTRIVRLAAWIGGVGVGIAGVGGMLTVGHPLRLVGVALMVLGPAVAGFGYLLPTFDNLTEDDTSD